MRLYRVGISTSEVENILGINLSLIDLRDFLQAINLKFNLVDPREQVILSAKRVLGKSFKRGASVLNDAPEAFDCSSLAAWVAVEAGFAIPRVTIDQYVFTENIQKKDLIPGDLVFANTHEIIHTEGTYFSKVLNKEVHEEAIRTTTLEYMPGTEVPGGVDHVGIYTGNEKIIHSSIKTGGVVEQDLNDSYSFKNIIKYGRFIKDEEKRFVVEVPENKPELRKKENLLSEIKNLWQMK
jgi:hypothetical protein